MPTDIAVVYHPTTFSSALTIKAGSSAFSTIPTMPEINLSADYNQMLGLTNRRSAQMGIAPALPYVDSDTIPSVSIISALATRINLLRAARGLAAVVFSAINTSTRKSAALWNQFRTALNFTGSVTIFPNTTSWSGSSYWSELETVYNSGIFVSSPSIVQSHTFTISSRDIGKYDGFLLFPTRMLRTRLAMSFNLSTFAPSISGFNAILQQSFLSFEVNNYEGFGTEDPTIFVYSSSSNDSVPSISIVNNLDIFEGTFAPYITGLQNVVINQSTIASRAGSYLSLVLGQNEELFGSGVSTTSRAKMDVATTSLKLDWGF
jgi:hypothetical protein